MTEHRIPAENFAALEAAIGRLARRAEKLGVPAPTATIVGDEWVSETDGLVEIARHFLTVAVAGDAPKFDGWTAAAVIDLDPEDGGAHVVHVVGERETDPTWRHETDRCDHCSQTPRGRLKLIVVEHDDTTRKVVGTTCVKDFLGHNAPDTVAAWFEILATLDDLADSFSDFNGTSAERRVDPVEFLAWAASCIDHDGWTSRTTAREYDKRATADDVSSIVFTRAANGNERAWRAERFPTDAHRTEAENALAWAQALTDEDAIRSDYLANVSAVANKAGWRWKDAGIGASIISAARRDREKELAAERQAVDYAASEFVGEAGKRSDFSATVTFHTSWDGQYGTTHLYRFLTDDGDVLVWYASRDQDVEQGDHVEIRGTVKGHEVHEHDGRSWNETKITRAKLVATVDA